MPAPLSAARFLDLLATGPEVFAPGCAGHSLLFESWLRAAPGRCAGLRFTGVHIPTVNTFDFAALDARARQRTIFLSGDLRDSWLQGRVDYLPMTYSATWSWLAGTARFDTVMVQVAPPDADGNCSLGVACDFTPAVWPRARRILAHINPRMPRTRGPSIPLARIEAAIEADGPLLEIPDPAADPAMDAVAARVAGLVEDRATLQLAWAGCSRRCCARCTTGAACASTAAWSPMACSACSTPGRWPTDPTRWWPGSPSARRRCTRRRLATCASARSVTPMTTACSPPFRA